MILEFIQTYKFNNFSQSIADIFNIDRATINNEILEIYKSNINILQYINNIKQVSSITNIQITILNTLSYYLLQLDTNINLDIQSLSTFILLLLYFYKNNNLFNNKHFKIIKLILKNKKYNSQNKFENLIIKTINLLKPFINNIDDINNYLQKYSNYRNIDFIKLKLLICSNLSPNITILFEIICNFILQIHNFSNTTNDQLLLLSSYIDNYLIYLKQQNINIILIKLLQYTFEYTLCYLINKNQNKNVNNSITRIRDFIFKYFNFYKELVSNTLTYNLTTVHYNINPLHIGVILDGNRRYATKNNYNYEIGYLDGAKTVKKLIDWCIHLNIIKTITLYVFSLDNYTKRSELEKQIIYNIISFYYEDLLPYFNYYGIQVNCIGNLNIFPEKLRNHLEYIADNTKNNNKLILNLAVGYDGQYEIINAIQQSQQHNEQIYTPNDLTKWMGLKDNIDLVIRTGGMKRSSNFFIWQTSYSEWYYLDKYWPEFEYTDLINIIENYSSVPKNYGK
jgi:undecaprenyl diphosphate synthase